MLILVLVFPEFPFQHLPSVHCSRLQESKELTLLSSLPSAGVSSSDTKALSNPRIGLYPVVSGTRR